MTFRPRRSVLYMPGSNARALDKARGLPADALIFDLEDAVAPDAKGDARANVLAALRQGGYADREVVVRINGHDSPWGADDIAAIAPAGASAILIPKVATPGDVMLTARLLRDRGLTERTRLWVMIETPLAVLNAERIASTAADPAARLDAFVIGANDLAKETRARVAPGRAALLPWLMQCLAAARAYGIDIIDGVYNDISDDAGFRAECEQGRDLGLDGKTLVHPAQVAICNEVFSPDRAELEWARKVVAVFERPENASKGAVRLDGRMVERLHADIARRTVEIGAAIAGRG